MSSRIKFLIPFLVPHILTLTPASAQKLKKNDKTAINDLQAHIHYLSGGSPSGSLTGTPEEKATDDYISSSFATIGLKPKGDNNGWLQTFDIDQGREVSADAYLMVNDHPFLLNTEYFPLAFSATGMVSGSPAVALQESGTPWFLDLRDLLDAGTGNPGFDLTGAIRTRAEASSKKGATALILYNSSKTPDNLSFDPKQRPAPASIPVLFITREAKRKYLKDESASMDIRIKVGFTDRKRTGHNVVGLLDNGAPSTVVICAGGNASGLAGMIELARMLSASRQKNCNYLFIAFSGEQEGASGSKWLMGHPPVDMKKIIYMIRLDRIGNLSDSIHALAITTYGNASAWGQVFADVRDKKEFDLHLDSTDAVSGDQAAFSAKSIPALLICTGEGDHPEDHAQGENTASINYPGELEVLKSVYDVLESANKRYGP
jgi:aminopeptidase YwaD